jgi:hypothetical protein
MGRGPAIITGSHEKGRTGSGRAWKGSADGHKKTDRDTRRRARHDGAFHRTAL